MTSHTPNRKPASIPPPSKHHLSVMIWLRVFPTLNLALGRPARFSQAAILASRGHGMGERDRLRPDRCLGRLERAYPPDLGTGRLANAAWMARHLRDPRGSAGPVPAAWLPASSSRRMGACTPAAVGSNHGTAAAHASTARRAPERVRERLQMDLGGRARD